MLKDEIIQEVWRGKDAVAAKYKHDAAAMAKALRDREIKSSATVINLRESEKRGQIFTVHKGLRTTEGKGKGAGLKTGI